MQVIDGAALLGLHRALEHGETLEPWAGLGHGGELNLPSACAERSTPSRITDMDSRGWEGPWSLPWKETRGVLLEKLFQRESIKLHGLGDSFCVLSCFCDRSKQNADTFRCCAVLIQLFKIPPPPPPHHMTGLGTKPVPINPCLELLLPL